VAAACLLLIVRGSEDEKHRDGTTGASSSSTSSVAKALEGLAVDRIALFVIGCVILILFVVCVCRQLRDRDGSDNAWQGVRCFRVFKARTNSHEYDTLPGEIDTATSQNYDKVKAQLDKIKADVTRPKGDMLQQIVKRLLGTSWVTGAEKLIHDMKLAVELIIFCLLIFYMDLAFDIQACITFWQTNNPRFLYTNVSAMVAAAIYTAYHIYQHGDRLLADLSLKEIFILGISYVFQMHVVFLCWISWKQGKKHQLLIDSKFAEAAIEAVISALVQTYAVVFAGGDVELTIWQQSTLYLSIVASLASISSAFTMFDSSNGIDEAPGNVPSVVSLRLLGVQFFRFCELTNKISAMALFQFATRPYGVYIFGMADYSILASLIYLFKGQPSYSLPCIFALMNPMLETHNVTTLPHSVYYILRAFELIVMSAVAWYFVYYHYDDTLENHYRNAKPTYYAFGASTVGMVLSLPLVRCMAKKGLLHGAVQGDTGAYTMAEWAKKPFSAAQEKLRAETLANG
jgi:hypothetical protein